jgi:sialic acid synthase SpsE
VVGLVKRQVLKNKIKIGDRWVGNGEPCFIIAEAGVNHNGDVALAKKLIAVAVKAGADAVKFQTFRAEDVITAGAAKARYQQQATGAGESQLEMIKKLQLDDKDFKILCDYARKKGIMFLSTPFDKGSVDFLDKLGVPAFKIASSEITHFPLLEYIARKKKPVILSTGMSTLQEIRDALEAIKAGGSGEIILLHCVSCYPARIEDMNLRAMDTLKRTLTCRWACPTTHPVLRYL